MSTSTLALDQISEKTQSLTDSVAEIQTRLRKSAPSLRSGAESAHFVALSLSNHASSILDNVVGSFKHLDTPDVRWGLLDRQVVERYICESGSIMIAVVEQLVCKATAMLAEVDSISD